MPITDANGKPHTMKSIRRLMKGMKESNPAYAASVKKCSKQQQEAILWIVFKAVNLFDSHEEFQSAVNEYAERTRVKSETPTIV